MATGSFPMEVSLVFQCTLRDCHPPQPAPPLTHPCRKHALGSRRSPAEWQRQYNDPHRNPAYPTDSPLRLRSPCSLPKADSEAPGTEGRAAIALRRTRNAPTPSLSDLPGCAANSTPLPLQFHSFLRLRGGIRLSQSDSPSRRSSRALFRLPPNPACGAATSHMAKARRSTFPAFAPRTKGRAPQAHSDWRQQSLAAAWLPCLLHRPCGFLQLKCSLPTPFSRETPRLRTQPVRLPWITLENSRRLLPQLIVTD